MTQVISLATLKRAKKAGKKPDSPCSGPAAGEQAVNYCINNPACCAWPPGTSPENPIVDGKGPVPFRELREAIEQPDLDAQRLIRKLGDEFELLDEQSVAELRVAYMQEVTADAAHEPLAFRQQQIAFFEARNLPFQQIAALRALRTDLNAVISDLEQELLHMG